jgi:electron transfer flavoprotein beta subunit
MNVTVCVKWVPDPQGTPELGPDHLLVRAGRNGSLDPGDEYGVELALQLVEAHGGEVTAVSMGPQEAVGGVQRALAMGAHRGVLITDDALSGADALATARVLAAAISRGPFDLVVAGVESTDGYTGTVPVTVAELLGIDSVTAIRRLDLEGDGLRVERQTEGGYDVLACPLPALVTVTAGATEPRYPSLKGIMGAKQKPLEQLSLGDVGLAPQQIRAGQSVVAVTEAPQKAGGDVLQAGPDALARVIDLLTEAKVI